MSDKLKLAHEVFFNHSGLTAQNVTNLIAPLKGDVVDAYFQFREKEAWELRKGVVKPKYFHMDKGVSIRIQCGEKTGLACSDAISMLQLQKAVQSVDFMHSYAQFNSVHLPTSQDSMAPYQAVNPLNSWDNASKVQCLHRVHAEAIAIHPLVKEVNVVLFGNYDVVMIADRSGKQQVDVRPLSSIMIEVTAEENGRLGYAYSSHALRGDYNVLQHSDCFKQLAQSTVRKALNDLLGKAAPTGEMPVVLGPGGPGVFLHEAVGHGLEGDFNRKNASVFSGKMGEMVASPLCTIVDHGAIPEYAGSLMFDDEGVPTRENILIENGVLKQYMQDGLNARLMNMAPTGNGRRESYAHMPIPRMTNTYMRPGKDAPEDIIRSVKRGLYVASCGGGQVDTASSDFVFNVDEAYMIEDGKCTYPVRGAMLIGRSIDVLKNISMVGHDLSFGRPAGYCGKDEQRVPVDLGMPTVKVNAMTVGGGG